MTDPDALPPHPTPDAPWPPPPTGEWVVGADAVLPGHLPHLPPAAARHAARLEARLAVYAQYAALTADLADATLAGDAERAAELAGAREAAAEHYGELAEPPADLLVPSFGEALAGALVELEHQAAADLAVRQRLLALREAMLRGAAWSGGGASGPGEARADTGAGLLLSAEAGVLTGTPADAGMEGEADAAVAPGDVPAGFGAAVVGARAAGVGGGLLGGRFPGGATRPLDGPAVEPAHDGHPAADDAGRARVDVRF